MSKWLDGLKEYQGWMKQHLDAGFKNSTVSDVLWKKWNLDSLIAIADYFGNLPKFTGNCSMCHVRLDQADINNGLHDESCPMSDEWEITKGEGYVARGVEEDTRIVHH